MFRLKSYRFLNLPIASGALAHQPADFLFPSGSASPVTSIGRLCPDIQMEFERKFFFLCDPLLLDVESVFKLFSLNLRQI